MEQKIADLILLWHNVHVNLGKCIESARVVLDQTDRGTLLPDRVREMRGELIATQEMIPQLTDLMEGLVGVTTWPMKPEADAIVEEQRRATEEPEVAAEDEPPPPPEPAPTATGDYDAEGSTPGAERDLSTEMFKREAGEDEESAAEASSPGAE